MADRRYRSRSPRAQTRTAANAQPAHRAGRARSKRGLIARFFLFIWRIVWGIVWRVAAVGAHDPGRRRAVLSTCNCRPLDDLLDGRARGSVTLLDRNGKVFAWRGETFGGQITAETVSPNLLHAVIATEDKRFYRHFGISPRGIASAIRINLAAGRGPLEGNGGSTITQQVAKLLVPWGAL